MRGALLGLIAALAPWLVAAQERIADIRQGTNLALTVHPGGHTLVVDLIGQLWTVPAAGGGAVPLTPAGEAARNPRYSPDGTHVVYQRLVDGQWDLWLLEIASTKTRPLTTSPFNEREPDFAADGRSVVFTSDRTGHYCLWSVTVEGGIETQLTEEPGDAAYPAAAQGLVAYAHEGTSGWSIRVLGQDGASAAVHSSARPLTAPSWRPGGGVIVFGEQDSTGTSRLWLLIRSEPQVLKPLSGSEDLFSTRPAWLSGAEFVYAADGQLWRRGIAHPVRYPVHLFAATLVAAAAAPLTLPDPDSTDDEQVAAGMSPTSSSADGRRAVFSALGDLWLAERGRHERLTDDTFADRDPALLPDGSGVIFSSDRNGQFELWHLALPERRLTAITSGAVLPRQPSIRPDGRQIAYLESESFEPWSTARLRVRDWPSGTEVTVATQLERASQPSWAADGRSLNVQALAGATSPETPRGLGVTLLRPLSASTNGDATPSSAPATVTWRAPARPADYVVEIGRLFDGVSGTYRRHVDLHVRAGRIAAIVARGLLPTSGTVVDARDHTVIPGLVDVHAHQPALAGERFGRVWLAHGVTTVREIADRPAEALERAESWASGRTVGPRLLITPSTAGSSLSTDPLLPIRPFAEIIGGFAHSLTRQARELAVPAQLKAATLPPRLRLPSTPGLVEIEVSPTLTTYQDGVSRLVASGATFAPGLAALSGMGDWPSMSPSGRRRSEAYRALFNLAEQSAWERQAPLTPGTRALGVTVANLVRAGGSVAIGSEAPAVPYGLGVHLEMAALARAGIAPDQILRMATMGGALALGLEPHVGSLDEGKLADFVVLEGDPLADLGAALDIVAVVKGGVWHDRAALLAPSR
jgi:dipeptidyl aminopeptidase/acylaminoacyl peptidase